MRVLVTGANGFLGPYVGSALQKAGFTVRAATRTGAGRVAADERVVVPADGERTDWTPAMDGVDAVVHLAARAHRPPAAQIAEETLYRQVNIDNTVALARQAMTAGARHFVYLSSIAVNGSATDGRAPFREDDAPAPETVYARTKTEAEARLREILSGLEFTAVRTPLIYGPGAHGSLSQLVRAIERGIPLPLGAVKNRRAFVSATNVARFIAGRLTPDARGGTFIVADDEQVSTPEFVMTLARALGRPARLLPVPGALLSAALGIAGKKRIAESLLGSLEVDTSKARATGWRPAPMAQEMSALFRHA